MKSIMTWQTVMSAEGGLLNVGKCQMKIQFDLTKQSYRYAKRVSSMSANVNEAMFDMTASFVRRR